MTAEQGKKYYTQLKELIESERIYKNPDVTLSYLADKMNLLERDISFIINQYGEHNFAQFINQYRINEAQRLITQDSSSKMISIAYESGFNNLSTFNQVFKNITGGTPSEFRKKQLSLKNSLQDSWIHKIGDWV